MKVEETNLEGCFVLTPQVFEDARGYFFESFNQNEFRKLTGIENLFVQDNQSLSKYGTIRGLHFQRGDSAQAKLVRVIAGEVLDVAVDLRPSSLTYGKYVSIILNEDNNRQMYIPKGFAHGFSVLSEEAIISYKCDNYYDKNLEGGIRFDDPSLNIDWRIPVDKIQLSAKDLELPFL